ncbi:MAG: prepilin-type N-terminal cleavage/methylation domain-containing protein [Pseudomonadota bacterium]
MNPRTNIKRAIARSTGGFTLIETMLAITLLALMMGMIYASLNISIRAWDAGDARVAAASNWRTVEHFLRREFGQIFPTRWRGVAQSTIAFEGNATSLRYVTALNLDAALQNGAASGLQWAELALQDGGALQLNRQAFDSQAQNFDGLIAAATSTIAPTQDQSQAGNVVAPVRLMDNVTALEINYFGADTDLAEPTWRTEWRDLGRLPLLLRLHIETTRGRGAPDMVVALKVGEEAGCLATNFTRQCGSRTR